MSLFQNFKYRRARKGIKQMFFYAKIYQHISLFQNFTYRRARKGLDKSVFMPTYVKICPYFKISYTGAREKAQKKMFPCQNISENVLISKIHIQARAKRRRQKCFHAKIYQNMSLFQNFIYGRARKGLENSLCFSC